MNGPPPLSRRVFLQTTATPRKVVVGAHPWIYAAMQPDHDRTPVLPQIFADFGYAGVDGVDLMQTALKPTDAVERIGELAQNHRLSVIELTQEPDFKPTRPLRESVKLSREFVRRTLVSKFTNRPTAAVHLAIISQCRETRRAYPIRQIAESWHLASLVLLSSPLRCRTPPHRPP